MVKENDIIICGYPSIDQMIQLDSTPKIGRTSTIVKESMSNKLYGGCSVNIAYAMSALGIRCGLSMIVGNDFESSGFKSFLEKGRIAIDDVLVNTKLPTSHTYLIANQKNEQMTLFYPGPMAVEHERKYADPKIDGKSLLITIGNLYRNQLILDQAIEKGIPVFFSMKGDLASLNQSYIKKVLKNCQIIFMNEAEKEMLDNLLGENILNNIGHDKLQAIIVTKGSKGSTCYTNDKYIDMGIAPFGKIVDTTGCGDAYIAGFLSSYLQGEDIESCMASGSVMSSFVIERFGCLTNIPNREDFNKRKKEFWT
ncbi:hypothetical protein D3H64_04635 [Atopobacter sp. AH10]|uniref:PfkB family carbohydrate kinase n=1 Tax=Atopobacter sp. AH10 TaxID=2315861 RepID=UPI000EF25D4A|nr:PfkB family carbohydrate kinase [Atopobacter sp. AH10]RLK63521.1 hypothetical protein D3H64_04635 [Atopobacter sp. AH10]